MSLVVKYVFFSVIATVINLGTQELSIQVYADIYNIELSILAGTFTGLLAKYILDKKYIFAYETKNLAHDTRKFIIYTSMGLITTIIFWGTEYGFHYLFGTKEMRYAGGVLGLAVGYWIKYNLDKKYVFI